MESPRLRKRPMFVIADMIIDIGVSSSSRLSMAIFGVRKNVTSMVMFAIVFKKAKR